MAWVSPKVYAILSNSEEGKDIIEKLGEMSQDECDKEVSAFFGEGGKGSASSEDYAKAKEEDTKNNEEHDGEGGKGSASSEDYAKAKEEDTKNNEEHDGDFDQENKDANAIWEQHKQTLSRVINEIEMDLQRQKEKRKEEREERKRFKESYTMPEEEGWKATKDYGLKAFIKNEGQNYEQFIQYIGEGIYGRDIVARYKVDGKYTTEHFSNMEDAKDWLENTVRFSSEYKKPEVKDYSSIKSENKRLDAIVGDASKFKDNPAHDAYNFFRETLEKNGFPVYYVEKMSQTWEKGENNEKYKEYYIKLKNSQNIYFRVIADKNYNTKEVIAYQN